MRYATSEMTSHNMVLPSVADGQAATIDVPQRKPAGAADLASGCPPSPIALARR
jgi:hypothetical protein